MGFAAYYMTTIERARNPVDVFIATRRGQVRLRGNSRRSLPDYIFTGPGQNRYYIVECKGTQSAKSTAIGQLQRGSEQVMTVDIDPPALATRLVIGTWLRPTITIFVLDPDEESTDPHDVRTLSRWSTEEVSWLSAAKRLTYVGDHQGAAVLSRDLLEQERQIVFEGHDLVFRETGFGVFVGSEQLRETPDGRQLQMFRGIEKETHDALRQTGKEAGQAHQRDDDEGQTFSVETVTEDRIAIVRSISRDGSLFEIRIRR
jgi:hypothetical protein